VLHFVVEVLVCELFAIDGLATPDRDRGRAV
jgi:hypothetical protein